MIRHLMRLAARPCFALIVAALLLLTSAASAQVLRLKTGKFLIGSVEEASEEGLRVRRLDTGGVLDLGWDDVARGDVVKLRKQFNLLDEVELEDVLFAATKIIHVLPTGKSELIGEFVARQGNDFVVRKKGQTFKISVERMHGAPQNIDVPIQDVLLPDEIYERKLSEIDPGEDADKHTLLGVYLIRVGDYPRAKLHLEKAKELGGGSQPREVEGQIERLTSLEANKAEADLIREINVQRSRRAFAQALALCDEYEKKFDKVGKLKNEFEQRKAQLEKDRENWLLREVVKYWFMATLDECGTASRTMVDFEAARSFAEEQLGQNVRARVAKRLQITTDEAEQLFKKRIERKVASIQSSGYNTGSWILGAAKVVEGTAAQKKDDKSKKDGGDAQAEAIKRELEKRVQDWMRQARRAGQGPNQQQQQLQTEAEWWKEIDSTARKFWLLSHYAETGGDYIVVNAFTTNCPNCGGRGKIASAAAQGNQVVYTPCPLCHETKFLRSLRFH